MEQQLQFLDTTSSSMEDVEISEEINVEPQNESAAKKIQEPSSSGESLAMEKGNIFPTHEDRANENEQQVILKVHRTINDLQNHTLKIDKDRLIEDNKSLIEDNKSLIEDKQRLIKEKELWIKEKVLMIKEKERLIEDKKLLEKRWKEDKEILDSGLKCWKSQRSQIIQKYQKKIDEIKRQCEYKPQGNIVRYFPFQFQITKFLTSKSKSKSKSKQKAQKSRPNRKN